MAKFKTITATEAPSPERRTGRMSGRMRLYDDYVSSVHKSEAGVLVPEDGETPRGITLRIQRAARRVEIPISSWVKDGKVYFVRDK